ncbi:MAG: hypothetical protein JW814_11925 [Candidatus Krumholzibacteriota bacterium]|nr:hypothetical protein [Candidatus Krumholzibacteriota bacterium]
MRTFSIAAVLAINLFIAVRNTVLIRRRKIKPALAMWIFFSIAVGGSLTTYLFGGNYNLLDNILNSSDLILCVYLSIVIFLLGDRSTRFTRFDTGCMIAVLVIITFWAFTRRHIAANLLIQTILVIAYFPVVRRLWNSDENTESFAVWFALLLAPVFSLLSSKGILASVYAFRAIISTSLLMALMARVELRVRRRPGGNLKGESM